MTGCSVTPTARGIPALALILASLCPACDLLFEYPGFDRPGDSANRRGRQSEIGPPTFTSPLAIAAGDGFTCAIDLYPKPNGSEWGLKCAGQTPFDDRPYFNENLTYASLRARGSVLCLAVSLQLQSKTQVICLGDDDLASGVPDLGDYTANLLTLGDGFACVPEIKTTSVGQRLLCWGDANKAQPIMDYADTSLFSGVDQVNFVSIGAAQSELVASFSSTTPSATQAPTLIPGSGPLHGAGLGFSGNPGGYASVAAADDFYCGLGDNLDGTFKMECPRINGDLPDSDPEGNQFESAVFDGNAVLGGGPNMVCRLLGGSEYDAQCFARATPADTFALEGYHVIDLDANGTEPTVMPDIAVGTDHYCVLVQLSATQNGARCFGAQDRGQLDFANAGD